MKTVAQHSIKYSSWLMAAVAALALTQFVSAQSIDGSREPYGTTAYSEAPALPPPVAPLPVRPTIVIGNSSYATGGVALRNRAAGNISLSGLVGPPKVTFLYWAVISLAAPPGQAGVIQVQRMSPFPVSGVVVVPGQIVGVGPAPCWGPPNSRITVFRAIVPPAIAVGNGSYQVTLLPGAQGIMNGSDPWAAPAVLPLWDGASMVMIGNGLGTVSIFDIGLAGHTFSPNPAPFNYLLNLPLAAPGLRTLIDNIGADGKHVNAASRKDVHANGDETTTINGLPVAGPGSPYNDSDWNGSSGLPVPELWDDTGHDITLASPVGTRVLNVVINSLLGPADCLTPVANVVEED